MYEIFSYTSEFYTFYRYFFNINFGVRETASPLLVSFFKPVRFNPIREATENILFRPKRHIASSNKLSSILLINVTCNNYPLHIAIHKSHKS